jgi:Putative prokaryotic signal transducing protein
MENANLMAYCPICGVEYEEGAEQCMDCQVALQPGPPPEPPPKEQTPKAHLVRVRVFSGPQSVMQADLARNILETEGIPCVLPGQYTGEMLPGIDVIQLFVSESDADRAREILQSYFDTPQET